MKKKIIVAVVILLFIAAFFLIATDARLKTVHYTVENEKSEEAFRVALVTDLHSCYYGENESNVLIEEIHAQNPDAVLFGGDIFDDDRDWENAKAVLRILGAEYSCYYITGNHEIRTGKADEIKEFVRSCEITVLEGTNSKLAVSYSDGSPDFYGFDDVTAYGGIESQLEHIEETIQNYHFEESFNVLLIHHPEYIESYSNLGFDLVLCGHAHGGQWRIPGILNGLYAPGQGFFPKYAGGFYETGETVLIVSRGLAKESTPLPRIFNRPELVIIDII